MTVRLAVARAEEDARRMLADADAAERLGCSPSMVRKLRRLGELKFIMVGRLPRIEPAELDAYIERQRRAQQAVRP